MTKTPSMSEDHKQKLISSRTDKKHFEETKLKMSIARNNYIILPETCQKISKSKIEKNFGIMKNCYIFT